MFSNLNSKIVNTPPVMWVRGTGTGFFNTPFHTISTGLLLSAQE